MKTLITNIQQFSLHDGPGIRTVVFFKGCSLECQWCANPEGIAPQAQIGFIENLCTKCGKCFTVCPEHALVDDPVMCRIDYNRCIACGKCAEACYYKALVLYGREMSVEEVYQAVLQDKMFYDSSGGGVTVSGGEPLLHADFVKALFELCKSTGIHTCVETSGYVYTDNLMTVLPVTDYLLYDIKLLDPTAHVQYTSQRNELIARNAKLAAESGVDIVFRIPLIPGINDHMENTKNTVSFLKSIIANPHMQLMPYHRLGESKYKALSMTNALSHLQVMTQEKIEAVKQDYIDCGVRCTVSR